MEKQEFCMEKSQIFQEMISRISKLSQDSYLMVTDMQHNLTFVPESTAEFLGIPSGWCEDGYKIVLEKSVHPYDCPEYTEEMKKRLRGINLENDLYIRMGKDKKYVMTQIITDMILEQGKKRYFIVAGSTLPRMMYSARVGPSTYSITTERHPGPRKHSIIRGTHPISRPDC